MEYSILLNISGVIIKMNSLITFRGRRDRDRVSIGSTTKELVPNTTKVVSSNSAQVRCTRYNIV